MRDAVRRDAFRLSLEPRWDFGGRDKYGVEAWLCGERSGVGVGLTAWHLRPRPLGDKAAMIVGSDEEQAYRPLDRPMDDVNDVVL